MHDRSYFLTLTYDDDHLPLGGSLEPSHTQAFFKALRKRVKGPLSYYLCGEYGDRTSRPHYHAVLYGPSFPSRARIGARNGHPIWEDPTISDTWPHGLHEFTNFTYSAALYTAGYVRKKLSRKRHPDHYERLNPLTGELIPIVQEFARMSNRPALGRRWFERYWRDVYPRDFVVLNGFQMKPPRYYDKLLEERDPDLMMEVREKRYLEQRELSPRELAASERIAYARASLFQTRGAV